LLQNEVNCKLLYISTTEREFEASKSNSCYRLKSTSVTDPSQHPIF